MRESDGMDNAKAIRTTRKQPRHRLALEIHKGSKRPPTLFTHPDRSQAGERRADDDLTSEIGDTRGMRRRRRTVVARGSVGAPLG